MKLNIAKSTARAWTTDVILSPQQKEHLYTKAIIALSKSPNNSRERRRREIEAILKSAKKELDLPISLTAFKLLGAMLYWAEGDKTKNFAITNSDPLLIKFMVDWFIKIFKIRPDKLTAHLNIYSQQNDSEIKKFWSELTGIPLSNFGKTFIKPANKNFKRNTLYYGTIKVRVLKGSDARERVFGWIKIFLENLSIETGTIQTRWNKLKIDRNFSK